MLLERYWQDFDRRFRWWAAGEIAIFAAMGLALMIVGTETPWPLWADLSGPIVLVGWGVAFVVTEARHFERRFKPLGLGCPHCGATLVTLRTGRGPQAQDVVRRSGRCEQCEQLVVDLSTRE